MSKLPSEIPGFLGDKLSQAQLPVDPSAWQAVSNNLPVPGAESVAASTAGSASVATKVAIWVGAAVFTAAAGLGVYALLNADENTSAEPPASAIETPATTAPEPADVAYQDAIEDVTEHPAGQAEAPSTQPLEETPRKIEEVTPVDVVDADSIEQRSTAPDQRTESAPAPAPASTTPASTQQAANPAPSAAEAPPAVAEADADFTVSFDSYDELSAFFTAEWQDGVRYSWDFGDGNTSDEVNPAHRFDEEGVYDVTIEVEDVHGFVDALTAKVEVRRTPRLVLPNIFTPNNDGLNDILNIGEESTNVTVLRLLVFDATGKIVFEQMGEGNGWDGLLHDGTPAPEGNYRLVVTAEGTDGKHYNESTFVRLQR